MIPTLKFTEDDAELAYDGWHCNCGPGALAAILGLTLEQVRMACLDQGFAGKKYMSPTMMKGALRILGGRLNAYRNGTHGDRDFPVHGLARIQWTGPWTAPGSNPKWAYRQTHWVASWLDVRASGPQTYIFDINGGLMRRADWESEIVPLILDQCVPRNDGGWFIANSWEIGK